MSGDVAHRAKIRLLPSEVLRLLGAPDSVRLDRVSVCDDPDVVDIIIEHPSLPAVYPLCAAPVLDLDTAAKVFEGIAQSEDSLPPRRAS